MKTRDDIVVTLRCRTDAWAAPTDEAFEPVVATGQCELWFGSGTGRVLTPV